MGGSHDGTCCGGVGHDGACQGLAGRCSEGRSGGCRIGFVRFSGAGRGGAAHGVLCVVVHLVVLFCFVVLLVVVLCFVVEVVEVVEVHGAGRDGSFHGCAGHGASNFYY